MMCHQQVDIEMNVYDETKVQKYFFEISPPILLFLLQYIV